MRILALLFFALFLSACGEDRTDERFSKMTEGQSLADWRNTHVWNRTYAGFVLNAIPYAHLIGLLIDTIYVVAGIDDLILGNGAIIARENQCEGMLSADDYDLFFIWNSGNQSLVMSSFRDVRETKISALDVGDNALARTLPQSGAARSRVSSNVLRSVTPETLKLVEKKVAKKVITKIGGKIVAKIIGKALSGFVIFAGPFIAGGVNYFILNDIDQDSREYFRQKAKAICGS